MVGGSANFFFLHHLLIRKQEEINLEKEAMLFDF